MFLSAVVLYQMQIQVRECMVLLPMINTPLLSAFSTATFAFLPVIIVKLLTLVIYWLALYNGGRAWELRPRRARAAGRRARRVNTFVKVVLSGCVGCEAIVRINEFLGVSTP